MYYLISGWDDRGNQIVEFHHAASETEAEAKFLASIGGGEVNEILDTITDEAYEEELRKINENTFAESERKGNDIMNANINNTMTNEENITVTNETTIIKTNKRNTTGRKGKRVMCLETGEIFNNATEAAKVNDCSQEMISRVCLGKSKTAKGKTFRYIDESNNILSVIEVPITEREITIQNPAKMIAKGKRCSGNTNAVLCISTGQVYTSCTDAAEQNDVHVANMSSVCRGVNKTTGGKKFCYVKDINEHLDEVAESIRKANMYDELMTKEEKRKELIAEVHKWEDEVVNIESEIVNLHENLKEAHRRLEEAKHNLMYFN